jgi:hypothetical protein
MVKFFAMAAALVATLTVADLAMARGRHGCASCGAVVSGGCPGGVCYAPVGAALTKMAMIGDAPSAVVATPVNSAPVVTQPAQRYYPVSARRGIFGWRR